MKLTKEKLKELILEALDESQYYYDAQDLDTNYANQAIELAQSMGDEDDRDRAAQVDKYVSLKVTKALKDAMTKTTMSNLEGLQNEAASHIGLRYIAKDFDEYDQRTYDGLGEMYKKALKRPLEALEQFDGTQESFDKWYEALKSVERVLMKARDPGMHYWGRLTPETLTISDYFITGREDDWGDVYERWDVKPETAVEEAEGFFRPAIMKTIMGIQSRKSGMDVGGMMGLTESVGDMFRGDVEYANTAIQTLITAGMLPEPKEIKINKIMDSIFIQFNSNEELSQLIDLLKSEGIPQQMGTSTPRPTFFVSIPFRKSDSAVRPEPTSLTLKV